MTPYILPLLSWGGGPPEAVEGSEPRRHSPLYRHPRESGNPCATYHPWGLWKVPTASDKVFANCALASAVGPKRFTKLASG